MGNFSRWYDKCEGLKKFLDFLETRPPQEQDEIAQEIIQIVFTESAVPIEESMQSIDSSKVFPQKRWYDRFPDLSNSLEVIRNLEPEKQQFILSQITESIYQYYLEHEDGFRI